MLNKTVQIKYPDLLVFLYPDFITSDTFSISTLSKNIIYVGKPIGKDKIKRMCKNYIATQGPVEKSLDTNSSIIEWAIGQGKKKVSKKTLELVDDMADDEFLYYFKIYWLLNKWVGVGADSKVTTYQLFKALLINEQEALKVTMLLLKVMPISVIESSLFTFLKKVKNPQEANASQSYLQTLLSAKSILGKNIDRAVSNYIANKSLGKELRLYKLIMDLKKV